VASVLVVAPSLVLALLGVTVAAVGSTSAVLQRADDVAGLWSLVVTVAAMAVFAIRWRRLRADPALRRRVQLVAIGFACTFLPIILANLAPFHLPEALFVLLLLPFPASVAAAVARRDLFDLDVAVNRTLVAVLSGGVLLVLYLLVVGVAVKVTGDSGPLVALPAAGVVAVSFAPVRDAVRRMINRRLHGSVSDPSRVFHRMGVRLSAAADPDALLTALVDTINDALRLPFGAIEVTTAEGWQVAEQRGRPTPVVERFDVVSGDEVVGRLAVSPRRDTGVLSTRDRQLLEDLARHSGVALRVASLLTELRTAQQRVRLASEQERHRIHRDLHDGVGPVLVGLALQLEVAADMAAGTPLGGLLARLHGEAARTIEDIRRLVKDLRPLELDQLGLATAVAAAAERLRSGGHPHIQVEAPPRLPACTPPVEDAAYKICLEAMSNAVRHSGATMCVLSIGTTGPGQLRIDVHDDGHGFEAAAGAGTGLQSMRERAAAVGGTVTIASDAGGTRIEATLPTGTL
jgi:signal transduction histidine kinase